MLTVTTYPIIFIETSKSIWVKSYLNLTVCVQRLIILEYYYAPYVTTMLFNWNADLISI